MKVVEYVHHGWNVKVRKDLKGRHRDHCLCHRCKHFVPNVPGEDNPDNCEIAQRVYELCVDHGLVLPVWECPEFHESANGDLPDPAKVGREYRKTATVHAVQMDRSFRVHTPEGVMQGGKGDYLCKGPAGEMWPVRGDIFEGTYKPISVETPE